MTRGPAEVGSAWPAWPLFGLIDDIRPTLAQARARGVPVAVVTLFATEGGSPRGLGAQMAVGSDILVGHVSGGCIEGDVAGHARAAIASGSPKRLVYGRGGPWDLPLPCGGRIELLIESVPPDDPALARLLDLGGRRQPCVWVTDGVERSCRPVEPGSHGDAEAGMWGEDVSGESAAGGRIYRRYDPQTRLVVVGGDPPALAIAGMAASMGMDAVLVAPQGPRASPPLAGVRYSRERPAEALAAIGLDRWTAVAACTHDADLDGETLVAALGSPAFFVGALGSLRRRAERVGALRAAGIDERHLARLSTPIGLDIGARTPWEIAVATMAELVAARPGRGG